MGKNITVCITYINVSWALLSSCTFNFDLTSQRTALENQVLGSYKDIEDELILVSAVRGSTDSPLKENSATSARKNQDFNRDDIEELKQKQVIGETSHGEIRATNKLSSSDTSTQKLAQELIKEENRDRQVIWNRIISANKNLSTKDLPEVKKTYAKLIFERSPSGQLFLNENNQWVPK